MKNQKNEEFFNFLESIKVPGDETLIESVKNGFSACFEAQEDTHRVLTTYEVIDEESAAEGDSKEHGWEDETGVNMELDEHDISDILRDNSDQLKVTPEPQRSSLLASLKAKELIQKTIKFLNEHGPLEFSGSQFYPHGWWTHYGEMDPATGETTNYGYHLKGYSEDELKAVYDGVKK